MQFRIEISNFKIEFRIELNKKILHPSMFWEESEAAFKMRWSSL
jgi:hypothetical protein